jgi:putative inorganic carbon (hco3(-)) transporter
MAARAVWRPPWYAWAVLGIAALGFTYKLFPSKLHGHWLLVTPLLVLVGVLALRRLWEVPPAPIMCAAIALTIFSGNWRLIGLGGLPLDRLLAVVVLLQFLLRAPGVAHTPRLQIRNVHLLLGVTVLYALASAIAAGTLTKEVGFLSFFDQLGVMPYLMFLLAPAVFSGPRERNLLLATLVGLGLYLGLTAIFESLGPQALVFPRYILHVDTELPGERAGGPFASSVAEGFATFACAVAAVIAFTQWHGRRARWLAAAATAVCVGGCFVTLERAVWIGAIVGAVATALLTRTGRRWLVPGALACALAIGGALVVSPALSHKTSARVDTQISVWDRENQTAAGLRMVDTKPLFGFGWDRYRSDSREYFRQAAGYPLVGYVVGETIGLPEVLLPLHDTYLTYAVELGLVGMLLWLASLCWGVGGAIFGRGPAALRPWKLGLLAIALFFVVVSAFNPLQPPFSELLLWVWAGVALGRAPVPVRERQPAMPPGVAGDVAWSAA